MVQVDYQLSNSFDFNKEFEPLFSKKKKSLSEKSKLDTKEPTQLKQINLIEIIKPLWIKLSRKDFLSSVKDVVNNLENKNYQTMISNDLTNVEQFLLETITKKISKNEKRKLYENLIDPKVIELTRAKGSMAKNKRLNILDIYNNVKSSIFEDVYFHYFNEPVITLDIIDKKKKKHKQCIVSPLL